MDRYGGGYLLLTHVLAEQNELEVGSKWQHRPDLISSAKLRTGHFWQQTPSEWPSCSQGSTPGREDVQVVLVYHRYLG